MSRQTTRRSLPAAATPTSANPSNPPPTPAAPGALGSDLKAEDVFRVVPRINLTADTYTHVLPTVQRAAAEKLDAMFGTG